MRTRMNWMRRTVLASAALTALATLCGCDVTGTGGYDPIFGAANFPAFGLYNPTSDIQSVVDYRQDVFDSVNDAWDDYIRE